MRIAIKLAALLLIAIVCALIGAQSDVGCTTVAVDFIGKSDRPIFPIIMTSSTEEGKRYRDELFGGLGADLIPINIAPKATLQRIANITALRGQLHDPSPGNTPITKPEIQIFIASGSGYKEAIFNAKESIAVLAELKQNLGDYPRLSDELSDMNERMNRYLKTHP